MILLQDLAPLPPGPFLALLSLTITALSTPMVPPLINNYLAKQTASFKPAVVGLVVSGAK